MTNFVLVPSKKPTGQVKTTQRDYILLDRSGSMSERWPQALKAVNTYIRKLAVAGVNTKITVAIFDHAYKVIRKDEVPASCRPITNADAEPRGCRHLNDAIGEIVALAKLDNPDRATLLIMTNGNVDCLEKLRPGQARALLTQCRLRGWQILFLGIDYDTCHLAQQYGASAQEFISIEKDHIAPVMARLADKRAENVTIAFSALEKQESANVLSREIMKSTTRRINDDHARKSLEGGNYIHDPGQSE